MKAYGGMDPRFLDLGTSWRWSASRSHCFTPRETVPCTHWIGGWCASGVSLDDVKERNILHSTGTRTLDHSAAQHAATRYNGSHSVSVQHLSILPQANKPDILILGVCILLRV
jgi:hypothetical protein